MGLLEIILYPDERLRQKAKPVDQINDEIRQLLDDMADTMYQAPGIGLAAPQVGISKRVIVVDVGNPNELENETRSQLMKLVNPKIILQEGNKIGEEGCLSIPDVKESVERAERVIVEALNEKGEPVSIDATGLMAVCLQHEIDHLDGVLFIDRLSRLKRELVKPALKKLMVPIK